MRTSFRINLAIALVLFLSNCDSADPVFYTINTTVNPNEAGTITPISGSSFEENTVIEFAATPTSGWLFVRWEGDLVGSDNPATVTMHNDMNVTAIFIPVLPLEGLLTYYPFNGNANDATGNGHDGTVMGATPTVDRFGIENSAYLFDGVDDYIDIGNDAALKIPFPITIAGWVRLEFDTDFIGYGIFTNNFDEPVNNGAWLAMSSTRRIAISYGNGGSIGRSSRRTKIGSTELEPGTWYHIAGIIRDRDDMSLYINGVNDDGFLDGDATELTYSEGNGNFGRRGSGVNTAPIYFQGVIDDLVLYNRELMEEEIAALYNSDRSTWSTHKTAR